MRILVLVAVAGLVLLGDPTPNSGGALAAHSVCDPGGKLVGTTVVYCGPAHAQLSVLGPATFENGSCRAVTLNGLPQFTVKLGTRTQNATTNGGRPYFGLTVSGTLSHPTGGGVIAYRSGKRWGGVGLSFDGDAHAGTFVARGIEGSHGRTTGSYRC